jgi:hypothetical protein
MIKQKERRNIMAINKEGLELQKFIQEHDVNLEIHENGEVVMQIRKDMAVSYITAEVIGMLKNVNKDFRLVATMPMPIDVNPERYEFILSFEERVSI